ncbi:MAG: ORC1-type DNA replication protein [Nanoarchaeota archaeon]|nr:ORC1-type DNA replication protein [Nanoarchaeota archaeon]MCK5629146.1 ORC1-type DNA replication protein [Nanoarchaeota archaeon]
MGEGNVTGLFERFLKRDPIFIEKKVLQSNYSPDTIPHRDNEITKIAQIIAPTLKLEKPSNLFIYGKTGTGKTLSVKHTTNKIIAVAKKESIPLEVFYLNCKLKKIADTEYRLIAELARKLGKEIPITGLPTDEVYRIFYSALDSEKKILIIVLDEIDQLVKKVGDELLYNLTRINEDLKNSMITLIGISNDLTFIDNIDPRVRSSLGEEEIIFPPYNAIQIQSILKERISKAFKEGVIEQGLLPKCAAYAAREHGDARRALELIRVAGEIAEREDNPNVLIKHLDKAEEKIERDRIQDIVSSQPKQFQTVLYAILNLTKKRNDNILTGEVYDIYKKLCSKIKLRPLTQRRISDVIAELDMQGIINARVASKGRYGRTREISMSVQLHTLEKIDKILIKELGLD